MAPVSFVGRQAELSQLAHLVRHGRTTSRPVVAIVRGDMGSGKTRLLGAAREALAPERLVTISGFELERPVPLGSAGPLLRDLAVVEEEGPRLAAVLEGLGGRQLERLQVFEAARRCLGELDSVALLIDDLQWVDDVSMALVHYLLRDAEQSGRRLAVLTASRPGLAVSAFDTAVRRLAGDPARVLSIELSGLDREAGVALVTTVRPGLDEGEAAALWERAAGLPFWLEELARSAGPEAPAHGSAQRRVAELTPDGATVAALLVASGAPTVHETVANVLQWTHPRLRRAVDELTGRGMCVRTGTVLRVVHGVVRAALVADLPSEMVREMHDRLARRIEERAGDDTRQLRQALIHRRASGRSSTDLTMRLLRSPHRRLLGRDDLQEFAQVADAAETPPQTHALQREIASLASELGQPDVALEQWTSLMLGADSADDRARARLRASQASLAGGDRLAAAALLAGRGVPEADPLLEIEWNAHVSELCASSGEDSEAPMRRAMSLADAVAQARGGVTQLTAEQRHAYLSALQAQLYFCLRTDRPEAMLDTAERISTAAESVEDRLRGTLHEVLALRLMGRYLDAERRARAARLAAVQGHLPTVAFLAGYLLARTLHSTGRLAEARGSAVEVAGLADRAPVVVPSWSSAPWISSLVPEIEASMVGWRASRPGLERLVEAEPDPHFRLQIRMTAAQWSARLAPSLDDRFTVACLEGADADARDAGCDRCRSEYWLRAGEAYARIGRTATASALLDRFDAGHLEAGGQSLLWRSRVVALIARSSHPRRSVPLLGLVCQHAAAMGCELEGVWAAMDLGQTLVAFDRRAGLIRLRDAAQAAHEMGAVSEERRAVQLMRAAGERTWRAGSRATGDSHGLTERELLIAQMVRGGASNPEIAEAMFLSRKTIERHVSNVLAKTGARNRAELAGRLTPR